MDTLSLSVVNLQNAFTWIVLVAAGVVVLLAVFSAFDQAITYGAAKVIRAGEPIDPTPDVTEARERRRLNGLSAISIAARAGGPR